MPELLLDYRVHSEQISTKKIAAGFRAKQRVQKLASQRCPQLWSNSALSIWKQFSGLLTAAPGSLGYEYLDWAYTYSLAGKRKISGKLVLRALLVAPLSIKANAFARKMMFECILGEGGVKVTRWYCNRIRSFFRNGI